MASSAILAWSDIHYFPASEWVQSKLKKKKRKGKSKYPSSDDKKTEQHYQIWSQH